MSDPRDEVLEMLAKQRDARADAEEASTRKLATARSLSEATVPICEALALVLGLSDGVPKIIAADARQLAAAESDFQAGVEAREAMDAVIAELKALRSQEP
jgi:hypothetical protein